MIGYRFHIIVSQVFTTCDVIRFLFHKNAFLFFYCSVCLLLGLYQSEILVQNWLWLLCWRQAQAVCVCLFASNFGRSISTVLAFRRSWRNINICMIICKLSFPQSFSTVLTTRHVKEGMIKRKDNVTTWSWRWFFSYLCGKCFVFFTCVEYVDMMM